MPRPAEARSGSSCLRASSRSEDGRIEIDPDERVQEAIRLVFERFQALGSARQTFLWLRANAVQLPVVRRNGTVRRIEWRAPAYHSVVQVMHNPIHAGAYAFGRTEARTRVVDGRAVKTSGHHRTMADWAVLIRDNHEGTIDWARFEENQRMLAENAPMKRRAARKSGRGGRALLTGMVRCGRCGRMMRVFYGSRSGHAHRYQCRGDDAHGGAGLCIGIGGVAVDKAIAGQLVEAVSERAVGAAILAAEQGAREVVGIRRAVERELEKARYGASLAERRYEHVDPAKRHVARALEEREGRGARARGRDRGAHQTARGGGRRAARGRPRRPASSRPGSAAGLGGGRHGRARPRQRLVRLLVEEVIIDLDDAARRRQWRRSTGSAAGIPRSG